MVLSANGIGIEEHIDQQIIKRKEGDEEEDEDDERTFKRPESRETVISHTVSCCSDTVKELEELEVI